MDNTVIDSETTLRERYGKVGKMAGDKVLDRLDEHCRAFIAVSPFLVIGSAAADGSADVSPKGDAPGFVHVLDARTVAIPDRIGNNRVDTLSNILSKPQVALIFMVPGMNETLRVNGRAEIVVDPELLETMAVNGKAPKAAIVVHIAEAFLHCAKAFIRSKLWDPQSQIARSSFPSLGRMIADQVGGIGVAEADQRVAEDYRTQLY